MRKLVFTTDGFAEYNQLLLRNIQDDPFKGLGKPEPLKGDFSGFWSRRISGEHRLVYRVTNENIEIIKCYGHYND